MSGEAGLGGRGRVELEHIEQEYGDAVMPQTALFFKNSTWAMSKSFQDANAVNK